MGVLSIQTDSTGLVDVHPRRVKIITTDNLATVTAAGYLNQEVLSTYAIFSSDIFDIFYSWNIDTQSGSYGEFLCAISSGVITLSSVPSSGVTTPTIANHIAVYTNTVGHLSEDAATAINGGNLQAGLSGTAGTVSSFPSAALSGKLSLAAVTNAGGNFNTTISNASSVGQSQVISIPDSGATTANFIVSKTTGTQHITVGSLQVDAGGLLSGLAAGGVAGSLTLYPATTANGSLVLSPLNAGGAFDTTIRNSVMGQSSVISIPDPGAATANFVLDTTAAGQTISSSTSSATPGTIRALVGSITESATTMTSGNIVGVCGVVTLVGASGGFVYGTQGKVIATGTITGSVWAPAVFGQLDISAATIDAGQMAPIWGDYGATSGTLTDQTGLYGIAMTNTTAAVLQGQLYLYGGAQNLMLLNTNSGLSGVTYFIDSGVSAGSWGNATPPTPSKVLKINVDGTDYYLPLVAQNT